MPLPGPLKPNGPPGPDTVIDNWIFSEAADYLLGAMFISLVLLSLIFNPLSFIYHLNRDKKLSSRLYTILAASDLLVTVVYPIFMSYNLLKSELDEDMEPRFMKVWYYGLHASVSWFTQILINFIVVVRCFKIINPFRSVSKKMVISGIILTTLLVSTGQIIQVGEGGKWKAEKQRLKPSLDSETKMYGYLFTSLVVVPISIMYICGGVASVVTAVVLYKGTSPAQSRGTNLAAARIIMCLTITNWIMPAGIILVNISKELDAEDEPPEVLIFFCVQGLGVLVSTMDPILVFILSSDMRAYVKGLFKRGALHRPVVHPAATTDLSVMSPSSAAVRDIDD